MRVSSTAAIPLSRSWTRERFSSIRFMCWVPRIGFVVGSGRDTRSVRGLGDRFAAGSEELAGCAPDNGARSDTRGRTVPSLSCKHPRKPRCHISWPVAARLGCAASRVRPGEHGWRRRQRRCWLRPCAHEQGVEATVVACGADDPHCECDDRRVWCSHARATAGPCEDRSAVRTSSPIAHGLAARSSPAARRSRPNQPRRNHPRERCVCRAGSSGTAPGATAAGRASPRRTSPLPGAWCAHGCACRPSALPTGPDTPALLPGSRTSCPSAASSVRGRHRTRPCPCDLDRAPCKEALSHRSAPEHRDREDSSPDRRCPATTRLREDYPGLLSGLYRPFDERPSYATQPTPACWNETPEGEQTCDCSPASSRIAACAGTCRLQDRAPSTPCRNQLDTLPQAASR